MGELGDELRVPFDIRTDREGDGLLIGLSGEIDISVREAFNAVLEEIETGGITRVMVDLSLVTFIDSTGLMFLMELWKRCGERGVDVVLEGASPQAQRLLASTGLGIELPAIFPAGAGPPGVGGHRSEREQLLSDRSPTSHNRAGLPGSFIPGVRRKPPGR